MTSLADFIPGFTPGAIGIWTLVAVVLIALVKAWPALRRIQVDNDSSLRGDLLGMVQELKTELHDERVRCEVEMEKLRTDNGKLHGQIHELRQQMALLMAAGSKEGRA